MLKKIETVEHLPTGLHAEFVTITPEIASSYLDTNAENRKASRRFVEMFTADMKSGQWQITGDAIKFDKSRRLIDGQHRLMACVAAEKPFKTFVVYGLDRSVRNVVDTGKARTGGDLLAMQGIKNANNIATALRFLVNEKRGFSVRGGSSAVSNATLMRTHSKHPEIGLYVPMPGAFPRGISVGAVGYVNFVGSAILGKKGRAAAMISVLKTGQPDYEGDPIHRYRERIIRHYADSIGAHTDRVATFQTLKTAWNAFAKKDTIERLVWSPEPVAIDGLDLKDL
jgi:hypothetical protein